MSWGYGYYGFRPYVSAAEKRARSAKQAQKLQKKGHVLCPVQLEGRTIARTFWGKAWCANLESYSDYDNRLPRGRTYVRNGSVLHLDVQKGEVIALVAGSSLYNVHVRISPAKPDHWRKLCAACKGSIGSLVELLEGRLSKHVMEIVSARESGLFPAPAEIKLDCSCPDWADMCKHVAAVLYGVGARLDQRPELLFLLRGVDHSDLISLAVESDALGAGAASAPTVASEDLAEIFGIDMESPVPTPARPVPAASRRKLKSASRKPDSPRAKSATRTKAKAKTAPRKKPLRKKKSPTRQKSAKR